jgi:tRNA modification GTPase
VETAPHTQTICAPITAVGGAVATIRLSGARSWAIAAQVFSPWPDPVEPRRATYGHFSHGDDGLALPFAAGASYTGEESVELSVHGSAKSMQALMQACIEAGAREAQPGEFTLRAWMNGRIDLTQAEGVRATVDAQSEVQLRQANALREGRLGQMIKSWRDELTGVLAMVEASTDFGEEVGELDRPRARARLTEVSEQMETLLASAAVGRRVQNGVRVALVGRPNAGKSSLLNALLREDRAIVTPIAGTTRDTLEESVEIHGFAVRLIDTAGLRESDDVVEQMGVQRTRQAIAQADFLWFVYDASTGWTAEDEAEWVAMIRSRSHSEVTAWIIANKIDLAGDQAPRGYPVSAVTGEGLALMLKSFGEMLGEAPVTALPLERHVPLLQSAHEAVSATQETLTLPVPDDLAAVTLRAAIRILGEITGETTPPDVIERVFRDFCIGK